MLLTLSVCLLQQRAWPVLSNSLPGTADWLWQLLFVGDLYPGWPGSANRNSNIGAGDSDWLGEARL